MNILELVDSSQKELATLLIVGVAFQNRSPGVRASYIIISHDGDEIGNAPQYMVEGLKTFLRRNYKIEPDPFPRDLGEHMPITYGHSYPWKDGEYEHLVSKYYLQSVNFS